MFNRIMTTFSNKLLVWINTNLLVPSTVKIVYRKSQYALVSDEVEISPKVKLLRITIATHLQSQKSANG